MTNLGDRLRKLRKKTGKSQKEFGKIFGLSESAIGMYERNERKPDYTTLERLANYLNTSITYLITGNPNEFVSYTFDKDEKDIAKRVYQIRKDLMNEENLLFNGEPMSPEAIESFLEAIEYAVRQTIRINKRSN
ncbi:immunity repressor protein [Bacillus cereus]|uniref:helix-turn-helix domain-containing protein n=1 Tax=Bacillus cereus TaxID=1396 RepID=UPI000BEB5DEA|nr:helix-turn-helix transcriptional regulator [Bacillus cereus]PEC89403.1 immunity repressor protein [Bacillus cereus]PFO03472.1 immunity repressor protein [Bacillus cereus]PFO75285.1 immunity repressor protein [Bacillus cereus]PGN75020.1 immunity repressor protein [Bacillus cereus]